MTKAIVLCGGKGTRLRPYTYTIPKPMLLIGKKPILEYVLGSIKRAGIKEVYLAVGYLHEQIESYFGDGSVLGLKLNYSVEKKELGTAGSVLPLKSKMNDTFVVIMGDHLSNVDVGEIVKQHKKSGNIATVALASKGIPLEYGVAEMEDGLVVRFREKPIVENLVNAGLYVFEPRIFDFIEEGDDFASKVFPRLLAKKEKIGGYVFSEFWLDIGRTADYEQINQYISVIELVERMK